MNDKEVKTAELKFEITEDIFQALKEIALFDILDQTDYYNSEDEFIDAVATDKYSLYGWIYNSDLEPVLESIHSRGLITEEEVDRILEDEDSDTIQDFIEAIFEAYNEVLSEKTFRWNERQEY